MKNISKYLIFCIAFILLFVNLMVFRDIYRDRSKHENNTNPHSTISEALTPFEPVVSDGSFTISPLVSQADVPEVIMTSLAGTETAGIIDEIAEEYWCVGMSVAVIKDGNVAYNYEYGFADQKKKRPLDSDTKFRIASLSKVYTSMLGMKLAEDGVIDLDGDIGDILGYSVRNPYSKKIPITMRMLLTHTSSLKDRSPYIFTSDIQYDLRDRESYIQRNPGTGHTYTNLGMGIAGAVIEKAAGLQLTEYSNQAFFNGMGIDAVFNGDLLKAKDNVADCISGGTLEKSAEELIKPHADKAPGENHSVAAGGLLISAVDYAKLMTVLINDGTYRNVSYLSPESVAAMHEVQIECNDFDQCIGIRQSDAVLENRTVYYHTGAAYGIFSLAIYDVTDKSGVVIFTTGSSARANDIGIRRSCLETAELIYKDIIGGDPSVSGSDAD